MEIDKSKKRIVVVGANPQTADAAARLVARGENIVIVNNLSDLRELQKDDENDIVVMDNFNMSAQKEFVIQNLHEIKTLDTRTKNQVLMDEKREPVRDSLENPKINRNELCPCGSGKKYKNCCQKK